jgi:hypothetical protein
MTLQARDADEKVQAAQAALDAAQKEADAAGGDRWQDACAETLHAGVRKHIGVLAFPHFTNP